MFEPVSPPPGPVPGFYDIIKGLAASSLLGTVISLMVAWARERSSSSKLARTLEGATKTTAFWDGWLRAALAANPEGDIPHFRAKVHEELIAIAATVTTASRGAEENTAASASKAVAYESARKSLPRFRRWFLLYRPSQGFGWVMRAFFYMYLSMAVVIPVTSVVRRSINRGQALVAVAVISGVFVFRYVSISFE